MRIKVLGCSGGVGPGLRTTTLLINDQILLDAGTGVGDLSLAQMTKISDVFLTHSHLDHVCGLAFMADNLFDEIERPLKVHASTDTLATLQAHLFNWKLWPDFASLPDAKNPLLVWETMDPAVPQTVSGLTFTAFKVLHTVPAMGYAVQSDAGVFAFSGDTYACDELWTALNALPRLDKLMIEVAFTNEESELAKVSRHLTPQLLGQELKKLKHRPQVLLTHHKPGSEARIESECQQALDGLNYRHLRRGDEILI